MAAPCATFVGTAFDGRNAAYVYVWFSLQERFIYVGQSNGRLGAFGRAHQHLGPGGTLRTRVEGEYGFEIEDVPDLMLLSYRLPALPDLTSVESSYREGLEFLVQKGVNERRLELGRGYRVVSIIRYNDAATMDYIRNLADDIVEQTIMRILASQSHLS